MANAITAVRRSVLQRCSSEHVTHPVRSDWRALSWLRQHGLVERQTSAVATCEYVVTEAGRAVLSELKPSRLSEARKA